MCMDHARKRLALLLLISIVFTGDAFADEVVSQPICAGGHISQQALDLFLGRPIDEVTEVKQGDQLMGHAHTTGQLTIELTPNAKAAVIDVRLNGTSCLESAAASGNKKPTVESQIDAQKSIVVDGNGLTATPAIADCKASLQALAGLELKKQSFAERLRQRAQEMASRQTDARVRGKLDTEVDHAISKASARLQRQPWLPADKAELLVDMLSFATTDGHVRATVNCDDVTKVSVPDFGRNLDPNLDFHLLLHEEFTGGLASKWFSGHRITDSAMLSHVERMRGRAPWALWVHDRRPRWAVTLADHSPVSLRFADDQIRVELRISSIEFGEDTLETPVQVTAVLVPESTDGGHRLRRVFGPETSFSDGRIDADRERFANMLRQKFGAFFPETIYFDGLKTPSSGSWTKFLQFELADFSASQGWFSVAFRLNEATMAADDERQLVR